MCRVCAVFVSRVRTGTVRGPHGAIAQLVERFHGMEEVRGSIPLSSTPKPQVTGLRLLSFWGIHACRSAVAVRLTVEQAASLPPGGRRLVSYLRPKTFPLHSRPGVTPKVSRTALGI